VSVLIFTLTGSTLTMLGSILTLLGLAFMVPGWILTRASDS
jgi:hypothetical protein